MRASSPRLGSSGRSGLAIWLIASLVIAALPAGRASGEEIYYNDANDPTFYGVAEADLLLLGISVDGSVGFSQQLIAGEPGDTGLDLLVTWSPSPVNIISRPQSLGLVPSIPNPYIADVQVTVKNISGFDLEACALAFTRPIDDDYPSPASLIGLDAGSVGFLRYLDLSPNPILPAVLLGALDSDESTSFLLRQVVAGEMPYNSKGGVVLPRLGVTGFHSVGEPAQLTLVTLGLFLLAFARRVR